MSIYKKTLLALRQDATPKAKCNKFIKLELDAQDSELKHLLSSTSRMYRLFIKPRVTRVVRDGVDYTNVPMNHRQWLEMQRECNRSLEHYVVSQLQSQTKEWQLEALRHGWTPPTG